MPKRMFKADFNKTTGKMEPVSLKCNRSKVRYSFTIGLTSLSLSQQLEATNYVMNTITELRNSENAPNDSPNTVSEIDNTERVSSKPIRLNDSRAVVVRSTVDWLDRSVTVPEQPSLDEFWGE